MAIIGTERSFYKKFKFRVEIDGITYAGFQKCSELSIEIAKVEHFEGGVLIPNKSLGRVTVPDITLERGQTDDRELWNWFEDSVRVASGFGGTGLPDSLYKRNFDIVQLDRDDTVLERWAVTNAMPIKFSVGEWDNTSDDNQIMSITLAIDYFEPTKRR
jgi:phage tail-like protein